jgi:MoaA/NifB/PqqE/SkfB family radical SAM enzyme
VKPQALLAGAWKHARARLTGANAWASVVLLLTFRCNQRCGYCDFPRHAGEEMPTSSWRTLLKGLRAGGTVRVCLSGGEPLLREDLGELVREASGHGFVTTVVTNATLLAERVDEVAPADFVLTSMEGDRESHDAIRGPGSWDLTVAGLEALRARGRTRVGLICTVRAGAASDLEAALRLGESLGVRVYFQPVERRLGWKGPEYRGVADEDELRDAFARVAAWKRAGRPIGNSDAYLDLARRGLARQSAGSCTAGRWFATVLPDGRVTPCCLLPFDPGLPRVDLARPWLTARAMARPRCAGCLNAAYVETNLLFSLDPSALLSTMRW